MAKIAVEKLGSAPRSRRLASGSGWSVYEVVCTAGPHDKPFEEEHHGMSVAIVLGGTFEYRSSTGSDLLTPGSLLLGNHGECFTCAHEHAVGDRCLSFTYSPDFFEELAAGADCRHARFAAPRLPPLRDLSPLVAKACGVLASGLADAAGYEALSLQIGAAALRVAEQLPPRAERVEPSSLARVTRVVRMIESDPDTPRQLSALAQIARLSPYHFLRVFEQVTGTTPHQYRLRLRLRGAALLLATRRDRVLDIALSCGFGDVSNFNRAFREEFGVSPRVYRAA